MNYVEYVNLKMLSRKVSSLKEFLESTIDINKRWGDSAIDVAIDTITKQREEILRLEDTISSMKSEIEYAMLDNKAEDVKKFYLENAIRYANKAIYIE